MIQEVEPKRGISYRASLALEILVRRPAGAWTLARDLADGIERMSASERLGSDRESRRRRIREVIAELRLAGVPIVGHPQLGVRIALDEADAEEHWQRVGRMARTAFVLGRHVRQSAADEPVGTQGRLF